MKACVSVAIARQVCASVLWCRCNNVLYMRGVPEEGEGGEDGEAKLMES